MRVFTGLPLAIIVCYWPYLAYAVSADYVRGWNLYLGGHYAEAHRIWQPLAEKDDFRALLGLSRLYQHGFGVTRNESKATEQIQSARRLGGLDAVYQLATMVQARLGPEVNLRLAEKLFLEAANQGHAPSQAALGQFYKFTNRDYEKSLYWYGKAAVNGENDAQYNMAFAHFNGNGTQKSPLLAYQWLTIAMENQGELGRYYTDKTRKRFGKDLTAAQKADAESKALAWLKKLGFLNPLPISTSKIIPRFPTAKVTELAQIIHGGA